MQIGSYQNIGNKTEKHLQSVLCLLHANELLLDMYLNILMEKLWVQKDFLDQYEGNLKNMNILKL